MVPGHGPATNGEKKAKQRFRILYGYLENLYEQLCEAKAGRKSPGLVTEYMTGGAYASAGIVKIAKIQRADPEEMLQS